MAKDCSFDIISKIDKMEVQNAVQMAIKEISTRYDFKGSKSDIQLKEDILTLISDDEFKLNQLKDVLISKLIKRNVPIKNLDEQKIEAGSQNTVRQNILLVFGIDKDNAKKINQAIKESKLKVKSQIQDEQIRITGKSKDELQQVIALLKQKDLPIELQFVNYRS